MSHWGTPEERFWAKVSRLDNGCWLWIGGRKAAGYGQFAVSGRKVIAHRWSYQTWVGPIPEGFEVDHKCLNRSCVNPEHLEAVTLQENRRRRNANKTHCPRGHLYDEQNTRMQGDRFGYKTRVCRTCERAKNRRWYQANRKRDEAA